MWPILQWHVLIQFSVTQVFLWSLNPVCLIVGLVTRFWSSGFSVIQTVYHLEFILNFPLMRYLAIFALLHNGFWDLSHCIFSNVARPSCIAGYDYWHTFFFIFAWECNQYNECVPYIVMEEQYYLLTDNHFSGVDFVNPLIVNITAFRCLSTFFVWTLLSQIETQYLVVE